MVRLNKIYTRTGDDGSTSLVGGERVAKDDARIAAYGTVDELNACLGMVRDANQRIKANDQTADELDAALVLIQQRLFNLGSSLATRLETRWPGQPLIVQADVDALEVGIDAMNAELEPLQSFVLPGGGPIAAPLHLARTVCRRAEREAIHLSRTEQVDPCDLRYLNRLSDWLFVASRWIAHRTGQPEPLWTP